MEKGSGIRSRLADLDENMLKVLSALCRSPDEGRQPTELWQELGSEMGKGTMYKRLDTLVRELGCVTLTRHPTDRRKVFYKIRPNHHPLCRERAAGFHAHSLLKRTRFQSLDSSSPGRPLTLETSLGKVAMAVFTGKDMDTRPLRELLEQEGFKERLRLILEESLRSLMKGWKGGGDAEMLILFYRERTEKAEGGFR